MEEMTTQLVDIVWHYGPKLVGAIVVWVVGSWVVKKLMTLVSKHLDKSGTDESLKPFLKSLLSAILKILLFITVLSMLGIEMTSFIAFWVLLVWQLAWRYQAPCKTLQVV